MADFLLEGGQEQSWLIGTKIVTITTSGGARVGSTGLCDKCLQFARRATEKVNNPAPEVAATGRKRHRTEAVRSRYLSWTSYNLRYCIKFHMTQQTFPASKSCRYFMRIRQQKIKWYMAFHTFIQFQVRNSSFYETYKSGRHPTSSAYWGATGGAERTIAVNSVQCRGYRNIERQSAPTRGQHHISRSVTWVC